MQLLEKMPETSRVRNQIPDTRRAYLDIWEESSANRSKNSETVREAPVCYEVGEERLNPLNDYLFSQYMGTEECRACLISFLNAVLEEEVKEVEIIKNIIQRSQYYNGRLYISGIAMGEDYKKLGRVISINILAYNGLDYPEYHLSSHFRIDQHPEDILSPYQEIHFLQLKKFYRSGEYDPGNPLHRWMKYFDRNLSREELEVLIQMDEAIKMAEERTERVAADEEERRFYEALEDWERDRLSLINAVEDAREEGLEKGVEKEKQEIARNSLSLGLPKDVIAKITGLTLQEIENLSKHEE